MYVAKVSGKVYDPTGTVEYKYIEGEQIKAPQYVIDLLVNADKAEELETKSSESKVADKAEELERETELMAMNRTEQNKIAKALKIKAYTKLNEVEIVEAIINAEEV